MPKTETDLAYVRRSVEKGCSQKALGAMRIPRRYYGKTIRQLPQAADAIKALLEGKSVFLTGVCGSGKTELAIGLMQKWYASRFKLKDGWIKPPTETALFLPTSELLLEIKASWDKNMNTMADNEAVIIRHYGTIDFLVLDDMGSEKQSEWTRTVFNGILDRRYRDCRLTIITSNKSLGWLSENIDDRIASRICEMGTVIDMGQKDWRLENLKKEV